MRHVSSKGSKCKILIAIHLISCYQPVMAQSPIQRAAARSTVTPVQPVPSFALPPLPDKIANVDREGANAWIEGVNETINNWVSQMNAANMNLPANTA